MRQTHYHAPDENTVAVWFDGWIIIHDHILSNTLRALSPLPHVSFTVSFVPCAFLVTIRQSIHLHILFIIHFLPVQTCSLCFTPTTTPCDVHILSTCFFAFPFPLPLPYYNIPSTHALISESPVKLQSRNFLLYFIIPFLTVHTCSLCFTLNTTPCDTHSFHIYLRFPIPPLPYNSLHCPEIWIPVKIPEMEFPTIFTKFK